MGHSQEDAESKEEKVYKERQAVFVPEGLVDIAKLYSQRRKPPVKPHHTIPYYDNNDEPEIWRDD